LIWEAQAFFGALLLTLFDGINWTKQTEKG
jgi:hypothetical protein